jgi:hypothetical protein
MSSWRAPTGRSDPVAGGTLPTVFISYRRDDASAAAGRLYDGLHREFGSHNVFIDVDTLRPGDDFVETIDSRVRNCDVLLAVIGPRWLTAVDSSGNPRIEDPSDYLRLELEAALKGEVRVIPVLVSNGSIPSAETLPEPLRPLTRRQAIELRDSRWGDDLTKLMEQLHALDAGRPARGHAVPVTASVRARRGAGRWYLALALGTATVLAATAIGVRNRPAASRQNQPDLAQSVAARLEAQCDGAEALTACRELANMYLHGRDIPRDYVRAAALYAKACEAGDMAGCRDLGGMYADGTGVERDEARGVALYQRACAGGDASGCLNQGYMYAMGRGVARDESAARPLYEKACEGGEPIGCRNLGMLYLNGRGGVPRDMSRAKELLVRACDGGDDVGCLNLRRIDKPLPPPSSP